MDGLATHSNASSIYVLGDDRMQNKVMSLAQKTIRPSVTLLAVNFNQLQNFWSDASDFQPVTFTNERRFFFKFDKLGEKFFNEYENQLINVDLVMHIQGFGEPFRIQRHFPIKTVRNHG